MTDRQLRQYQMLLRLRDFGRTYADRFPEATLADEAFAAIGEALNQLNTHAVERLAIRRLSARARAFARAALVTMMDGISRTARLLQSEDPGFPNTFLMPERRSAQAVLTAARLFARDVAPFADRFIAHAFGDTFPENFKRLLQVYEEAVQGRESGKGQSAASRATIEAALTAGFAAARRLDVIVANTLGDDPVAVAEWERNRRVGYRRTQTSPEPPPVAPTEPLVQPSVESPSRIPASSVTPPEMTTAPIGLAPESEPLPEATAEADVPEDVSADVADDEAA